MKPTVEEWTRFETAAMAMIEALPFKDDRCVTCGNAMKNALKPDKVFQWPMSEFLDQLKMAVFLWEQDYPMECYYCQQEENEKQAMAEAGFNW